MKPCVSFLLLVLLSISLPPVEARAAGSNELPEDLKSLMITLVNSNSGSLNPAGLETARAQLIPLFTSLGYAARTIDAGEADDVNGQKFTRKVLVFEIPGSQPDIMILGHLDTVFELSSTFQQFRQDGNLWRGPGVADMKGCWVMVAHLLRELGDRASLSRFRILINDDEERGSPNSGPILKQFAAQAKFGLIFESTANAETDLTSSHSGVLTLQTTVFGVAAHAGLEPTQGVSAILDNSMKMLQLYRLNDLSRGRTVNAGVIHSPQTAKPNIIADQVVTQYDVRFIESVDLTLARNYFAAVSKQFLAPNPSNRPVRPTLVEQTNFGPAMPPARTKTLLDLYTASAAGIGMQVSAKHKGAVDNYGILETPIELLSGLGFYGGGMHSADESARADLYSRKFAMNLAFFRALVKRAR